MTSQQSISSSLEEAIIPKEIEPPFIPLVERWLQLQRKFGQRCADYEPNNKSLREYFKVRSALLSQMPLREDQLSRIPALLPDTRLTYKPPTMYFGWVIGTDELERLGRMHDVYQKELRVDFYSPEDPRRPKRAKLNSHGVYEIRRGRVFAPRETAKFLASKGAKTLGLRCGYNAKSSCFMNKHITQDFDTYNEQKTAFISIYSNLDLLPERQAKEPLPTPDNIREFREWLGLGTEREPGWWFGYLGLAKITWKQLEKCMILS